ncbi:uncharacterized protein LOC133957298 isoform X2 [Platichthys flesus]|uniref:uncharacterized protein LOC133957298 isoform X2 n=1 Tax=Platichthys flesus TaxID=8260 RepID=UPI002DBB7484|nr:uncharacterized protein LOC133957298 isoform X2 [Platichthys flesus]
MPMLAFFIKLLLVHYTTQSTAGIQAVCGGDVSLPCLYEDIESMDFISLAWYKLNNQSRNGIIRWKTRGNVTSAYSLARAADFGDKYSLMLRNVTPEDSGNYDCYISANIGGTNRNSYVYLTVQGKGAVGPVEHSGICGSGSYQSHFIHNQHLGDWCHRFKTIETKVKKRFPLIGHFQRLYKYTQKVISIVYSLYLIFTCFHKVFFSVLVL